MLWKEYRLTRTRTATAADENGQRRVLELLDGCVLIELDGAPAQIVKVPFEQALTLASQLTRGSAPLAKAQSATPFWLRVFFAIFGGGS
jgi:hypothetical protein